MLKTTLIATATAVALTFTAAATAAPATTQTTAATTVPFAMQSEYIEVGGGKKHGKWQKHGPKHGYGYWKPRRACRPIVRWRHIGYGYHKRWKRVVVGWNCHRRPYRPWYWH